MLKKLWISFLFLGILGTIESIAQEFGEPWHYSILNGLPSTTIYEFYKDSKGLIWFGTENGAVCFNGQDFKVFNQENGLRDEVVIRIREDRYGRIWFHHQNNLPSYYREGKIHNFDVGKYDMTVEANSRIIEDKTGMIWLGGKGSYMNILPNDSIIFHDGYKGHDFHFFQDEIDSSIVYYDFGSFHDGYELPSTKDLKLINAQKFFSYLAEHNIMSTETFLRSNKTALELVDPLKFDYKRLKDLSFMNFHGAFFVKRIESTYFVGQPDGLHVYRKTKTGYSHELLLEGKQVGGVIEDDKGGLLVGTLNDGLYHFAAYKLKLKEYNELVGVTSIDRVGNDLYVGMNDGTVYKKEGERFKLFTPCLNPKANLKRINHIGSWRGNLVYSSGNVALLVSPEGKLIDPITFFTYCRFSNSTEKSDTLAIATSFGVLFYTENEKGKLQLSGEVGKSILGRVQDLFFTNNGILVACQSGTFKTYRDSVYPLFPELFRGQGANSIEMRDDYLLIASRDRGIAIIRNGNLVRWISVANGLMSNNVRKIEFKGPDCLFVVTDIGSEELIIDRNYNILKRRQIFDFRSFLGGKEITHVVELGEYFYLNCMGTMKRVKKKNIPKIQSLRIFTTSIGYGNDEKEFSDNKSVPFNQNNIHLNVDAVNFSKYPTRFFYRINEEEWRSNFNGQIDLQSLTDGDYRLEVYATSNFYNRSNLLEYSFTILPPWYRSRWFIGFALVLLIVLTSLFIRWRAKNIEARKTELLTMELASLQAQMNPHFTFNTLNSIQNYILKNDTRSSIKYLSEFSILMRKILDHAQIQLISIDEEVSFLSSYIELEKQRLKNSFEEEIVVDKSLPRNAGIPSMLLQPFVENAIWHGLSNKKEGGILSVHFERLEARMIVTVSDNGTGRKFAKQRMNKAPEHKSKGMNITQNRIRIIERLYKAKIEFSIFDLDETEETGTIVRIDLPLMNTHQ